MTQPNKTEFFPIQMDNIFSISRVCLKLTSYLVQMRLIMNYEYKKASFNCSKDSKRNI